MNLIDDLYRHRKLSLAASHGAVAFSVQSLIRDSGETRSVIWICRRDGALEPLSSDECSSYGPAWSHDGRRIAFVRSSQQKPQVLMIDLEGGHASVEHVLPGSVASIEQWDSERARMLLRITHQESAAPDDPYVIEHVPYKSDGLGYTTREHMHLHQLDEKTGRTEAVVTGADVLEARWSPDGATLAYVQRADGRQRHATCLWLKQGDQARRIAGTLVSVSGVQWSPDGTRIALAGSAIPGDSMSYLHVVDVADGKAERIGDVELVIPACIEWMEDGGWRVVQAWQGRQRLVRVRESGEVEALHDEADLQIAAAANVGGRIAFIGAGPASGPELYWCDADGGNAQACSTFNAWRQAHELQARCRRFTVPDGKGGEEDIDGWLITPRGEGPFPLLLDMHGGPHSTVMFEYERHVHWPELVARGWAILALNAVGSNSYGEAFAKRINGAWGELDWPQWQAAARTLRSEGIASDVLATFGHSYGGYLSAWALGHDDTLAAGVVSGAVIDLVSHTGTSDTGYYVGPYTMQGEPEDQRELFDRLSPLSHARQIRAPTLILQGEDDQRCPVGQGEELFTAITRADRTQCRMVLFPGGSHHLSSTGKPAQRVRYYQELCDWLQQHAKCVDEDGADRATSSS